MTAAEILREARDLIVRPEAWCRHAQSLGPRGSHCDPWASEVTQRCALGAISAVMGRYCTGSDPAVKTLFKALPPRGGAIYQPIDVESAIINWNDNRDRAHCDVVKVFDTAIALAAVREVK